jgi:hypothetical protein
MSRKGLLRTTRSSRTSRRHRLLRAAVLSLVPLTAGCAPPAHAAPIGSQERLPSTAIVCGLAAGNGPRVACSVRPSFSLGATAFRSPAPELTAADSTHLAASGCDE